MTLRLFLYLLHILLYSKLSLIFPEILFELLPSSGINSVVSNLHFPLTPLFLMKDLICGTTITCLYTVLQSFHQIPIHVTATPKGVDFPQLFSIFALIYVSPFLHFSYYAPLVF